MKEVGVEAEVRDRTLGSYAQGGRSARLTALLTQGSDCDTLYHNVIRSAASVPDGL